jgi:putative heme-binding domain-containing protein
MRLEAIRTLRQRTEGAWWPALREIAMNDKCSAQERCEAILALSPERHWDRRMLFKLIGSDVQEVCCEALRALRGADLNEREAEQIRQLAERLKGPGKELAERVISKTPPNDLPKHQDVSAWLARTDGNGDPQAGERIFFHSRVAECFRCHEFEGRGNTVGPELSTIGMSMTRERLVQSLVDPSREIAPQFTTYSILKHDGALLTGIHIGDEVDGRMRYVDPKGTLFHVHPNDVEQRQPSSQSIMPEGLVDQLTQQELRDLMAFLLRQ